jgi:hypothetical protein
VWAKGLGRRLPGGGLLASEEGAGVRGARVGGEEEREGDLIGDERGRERRRGGNTTCCCARTALRL